MKRLIVNIILYTNADTSNVLMTKNLMYTTAIALQPTHGSGHST